jgi:allose kinase
MAVVAIDVGGTFIRATAADVSGAVITSASQSAERLRNENPINVFATLIEDIRANSIERLAGVVIGIPGILDRQRRSVVNTPNVKALNGLALADRLEDACRVPVYLDHDATLQTRGEALCGSAAGFDLVLGVYFGTGVGAAFIDHGKLVGGIYRTQIGHVPLRGEGRVGTGGAVDCVEAYASGLVLEALANEHGVGIQEAFETRSEPSLERGLEMFVRDQGLTIATAVTLLDPEVVVIGGGVTTMRGYPFERLVQAVFDRLSPEIGPQRIKIVRANLGSLAAVWGAKSIVESAT